MIQLPVTIIDKTGAKDVFESLGDAESNLEAVDVRSNEYRAYDAEGKELQVNIERVVVRSLFGLIKAEVEFVRISEFPIKRGD